MTERVSIDYDGGYEDRRDGADFWDAGLGEGSWEAIVAGAPSTGASVARATGSSAGRLRPRGDGGTVRCVQRLDRCQGGESSGPQRDGIVTTMVLALQASGEVDECVDVLPGLAKSSLVEELESWQSTHLCSVLNARPAIGHAVRVALVLRCQLVIEAVGTCEIHSRRRGSKTVTEKEVRRCERSAARRLGEIRRSSTARAVAGADASRSGGSRSRRAERPTEGTHQRRQTTGRDARRARSSGSVPPCNACDRIPTVTAHCGCS